MGTPYIDVYTSFLGRINDNTFVQEMAETLIVDDLKNLMVMAINDFKFPVTDLSNRDDLLEEFVNTLNDQEVDILARYMKAELAQRCVTDWRLVYPQYQTKDFQPAGTPANLLSKLGAYAKDAMADADKRSSYYHRAYNHKPYDFSKLAGSNNG